MKLVETVGINSPQNWGLCIDFINCKWLNFDYPWLSFARNQKILWGCSFGFKTQFNYNWHTIKFHNCHHINVSKFSIVSNEIQYISTPWPLHLKGFLIYFSIICIKWWWRMKILRFLYNRLAQNLHPDRTHQL